MLFARATHIVLLHLNNLKISSYFDTFTANYSILGVFLMHFVDKLANIFVEALVVGVLEVWVLLSSLLTEVQIFSSHVYAT